MASVASRVKRKVSTLPAGAIFRLDDISNHRDEILAVAHKLSRMVKSGEIKRVSKGRYFKPRHSVFGELGPAQSEVLKQLVNPKSDKPAYVTGIALYNNLGLTNQVPAVISVAYNKERAPLELADVKVKFVKQSNKITRRNIPLLRILDVIKGYNKIPNKVDKVVMEWLQSRIESLDSRQRRSLINLALSYNPRSRALLGAILDHLGFEEDADRLRRSINPLSRYEVNISSDVLSKKEDWGIV